MARKYRTSAVAVASICAGLVTFMLTAMPVHADEWREKQWHLDFLKADEVHKITKGDGVTVAVVDTGVDGNHRDLQGNVLKGTDVIDHGDGWKDVNGHGTAMASLIAGHGHGSDQGDGAMGLAPNANVLPVRTFTADDQHEGDRERIIEALTWAADSEATVINFSGTMSAIRDEVEKALARDKVFVAGVGNASSDIGVQQPASYPGVVAVSGLDRNGNFTDVSVEGPEVVLSAPAVEIAGAGAGERGPYFVGTGTSGASALVSATAALIRAKYPDLSANGVINRLIKTADDKGAPGRDPKYGFGVVNPLKALTADIPDIDYNPLIGPTSMPSPSPTATATAPAGVPDAGTGNLLPALAAVGVGTLLVAGGVAFVVRRRRRADVTQP